MSTKRGDPRLSRAYRKARLQALDRGMIPMDCDPAWGNIVRFLMKGYA